jgi:hypothetical protein
MTSQRAVQEKRIAIGRRRNHGFGADVAAGARPVLDNELLAELVGQGEFCQQTSPKVMPVNLQFAWPLPRSAVGAMDR